MSPFLSIIIPLYNKQNYILKTVNSVLSQDFDDYEIIVVDDGSTDNSVKVVESITDIHIRLFRKENGGPSSARNYGARMAKGEWILFLDADDKLVPNTLSFAEKLIKQKKNVDVFTFNLYTERNNTLQISRPFHATGRVYFPFLYWYLEKIYPRTGNVIAKRKVFLDNPYNEKTFRHEDTENTFCLMGKYKFYACEESLFVYNQETLEASHGRKNLNEDFCCVMKPKGKPIFQQLAMYKLYRDDTSYIYPHDSANMYIGEFNLKRIERWEKNIRIYKKNIRRINRIVSHIIPQKSINT